MRIKRFNENQQYLTEPYDPDTKSSFFVDYNSKIDILEKQLELLSKNLGLEFKILNSKVDFIPAYQFKKDEVIRKYYWEVIYDKKDPFIYGIRIFSGTEKEFNTIDEISDDLKEFFNL